MAPMMEGCSERECLQETWLERHTSFEYVSQMDAQQWEASSQMLEAV